jgi:hypothetical protein
MEYKVGDRVNIRCDSAAWNGPGTVEGSEEGYYSVRTDDDGRLDGGRVGLFSYKELRPLKWWNVTYEQDEHHGVPVRGEGNLVVEAESDVEAFKTVREMFAPLPVSLWVNEIELPSPMAFQAGDVIQRRDDAILVFVVGAGSDGYTLRYSDDSSRISMREFVEDNYSLFHRP